jgi:hypothetical protein
MPRAAEVRDSADLRRILALPSRPLSLAQAREDRKHMTQLLALQPHARLRVWQAFCLAELLRLYRDTGIVGQYAALSVGAGKTLLTWLICVILQARAPILLLPGGLKKKTYREFREFVGVWKSPKPPPRLVGFEDLTNKKNVDLLARHKPDVLIIDESDRSRNSDASVHKRIAREVFGNEPAVIELTATPGRHSALDYMPQMVWALGQHAPVPTDPTEQAMWAAALDEKPKRNGMHVHIGALAKLCRAMGEPETKRGAQNAFRKRVLSTPGVVIVRGDSCEQPLTIKLVCAPEDPILDEHYKTLRRLWITPGGIPLMQGEGKKNVLSYAMHCDWLGAGLYYEWDPKPPKWWLEPRIVCAKFVRGRIKATANTRNPLDTYAAVVAAYPDDPRVTDWLEVKNKFKPNSVERWISASTLQYASKWLQREGPAIAFCGATAFGEALAKVSRLQYYADKGCNAAGVEIDNSPKGVSAVSSWQSNLRGRNLQYHWHKALLVNITPSALYLEQLFGRIHRAGQEHPVEITVLCTSGDSYAAWDRALGEARQNERMLSLQNKILRATVVRGRPTVTKANRWRWLEDAA